jgi:hypothetical protein
MAFPAPETSGETPVAVELVAAAAPVHRTGESSVREEQRSEPKGREAAPRTPWQLMDATDVKTSASGTDGRIGRRHGHDAGACGTTGCQASGHSVTYG